MIKYDELRNGIGHIHLAAVLLTRLPLPLLKEEAFEGAPRAVWAYPVVGLGVGLIGAVVGGIGAGFGLPTLIVAGLYVVTMMLITGAMHEDGLADSFDGFWGAQNKSRRLEIMRDSQIGSYGVLALIMVTGMRWGALVLLLPIGIGSVLAAAMISRAMMPALMVALPYARQDGLSRSVGKPAQRTALIGLAVAVTLSFFCIGWTVIFAVSAAALVSWGTAQVATTKIEGQTGDVLGATQQLSELAILLVCLAVWA